MKILENSERKNSYFSNLCSAAFTMTVFFVLVIARQSILSQFFNFGKTGFFICRKLDSNRSNTFQRKISTAEHGSVFSLKSNKSNGCDRKQTMHSCDKTFKQVLSFLSNLTSAIFIFPIGLCHDLKFEAIFLISEKVASSFFG